MARYIVLLVAILAVANARWVEDDNDAWNVFNPFKMVFPQLYTRPRFPQGSGFPFGGMGIVMPKLPSVADIMNTKPGKNQVYNGVVAKSSSSFTTDKYGNPVRTGGTVVVTNNNGDVKKYESGDKPPNIKIPKMPEFPKFPDFHIEAPRMPDLPHLPIIPFEPTAPFKPFEPASPSKTFDPISPSKPFEPILPLNPLDPNFPNIPDINHQPGENEVFHSVSSSSYSHSSNINGKESSAAGTETVVNNNGAIDKEAIHYAKADKP